METGGTLLVLCNTFEWERQYNAWAFRSNVAWLVPETENDRLIHEGKQTKTVAVHAKQETLKKPGLWSDRLRLDSSFYTYLLKEGGVELFEIYRVKKGPV